ncbi:galactonate dehydratase [Brachybacterium sp. GCM10030252]|uniref:galactonate dehydratase n=1 Tax=Brachybacterium sp. GCM10030252 TaxID=3273380 RepID=UPI00360866B1
MSDRIAAVRSYRVAPRWILVRVDTEDGLTGWGESINPKRAGAVQGALADLEANVRGRDPDRIEQLRLRMRHGGFFRGGPVLATAAAAIECALWDIRARRLNSPVHGLLGGAVREHITSYAWVGGDRPAQLSADITARLEQGYSMVKMNATAEFDHIESSAAIDAVIERVGAVREEFGSRIDVALDFHGRVHRSMARTLVRELETFRPAWIEEPLPPGHEAAYAELFGRDRTVPIATGERMSELREFLPLLEARVVDVLQPDVSLTGIAELVSIARVAEAYDVAVAPHCPNGPVSLAASLQAGACAENIVAQEQSLGLHYNRGYADMPKAEMFDYLREPAVLRPADGRLAIPPDPGLGLELDEDAIAASPSWSLKDPDWRYPDGRSAEW